MAKSGPDNRVPGRPDGQDDMINKYGTYNIQPTGDTENDYPQIAQGLARETAEKRERTRRPTQRDGTKL